MGLRWGETDLTCLRGLEGILFFGDRGDRWPVKSEPGGAEVMMWMEGAWSCRVNTRLCAGGRTVNDCKLYANELVPAGKLVLVAELKEMKLLGHKNVP